MQDTVKQDREKYVGGSDIPIILGISHFKTRWQLVQEKAQVIENGFDGNQYTEYGNIMEEVIRNYISFEYLTQFKEDILIDETDHTRCHCDGIDKDYILEIKTTSNPTWEVYRWQTLFYMWKFKRDKGIIAIYKRPDNFSEVFDANRLEWKEINIKDYEEDVKQLPIIISKFWEDVNNLKATPTLTESDFYPQVLKDKLLEVAVVTSQLKSLQLKEQKAKTDLLKFMLDNNYKTIENDILRVTKVDATQDSVKYEDSFDLEAFKEDYPDLYVKYTSIEKKEIKGKKAYLTIKERK